MIDNNGVMGQGIKLQKIKSVFGMSLTGYFRQLSTSRMVLFFYNLNILFVTEVELNWN